MYYFDPTYILVIIGALISMLASGRVNSTYAKYNKVRSMSGMTGADAAARILQQAGLYGIRIEHISGNLTDHYDPRDKVLRLSDTVYGSPSIAAIGVAAHECGHAIQDQEEYFPLKFRNTLVPVANIGTKAAIPIILLGMVLSASQTLINIGVMLFSLGVLFQLVTLPVEFNASNRAIRILEGTGMLQGQEVKGAKKVLGAAAMTYVAAAAASILSLLRLMLLFGGRRRND
ncbi:MAG: zinc metallopeptidase [Lachnospiraceae bacterium]|jgi:Zn-dependent membrane protease YugP|nr:zinc metallopeptidase [Lachnospiraceae bacterium]MCI8996317.1 zinc metallopeptidase [Lachnospiraceae bacterium]MCI9133356.1 zinc metallopeptidase [Lachnospiraceae bacterium]